MFKVQKERETSMYVWVGVSCIGLYKYACICGFVSVFILFNEVMKETTTTKTYTHTRTHSLKVFILVFQNFSF